jgi:hypothetical protein
MVAELFGHRVGSEHFFSKNDRMRMAISSKTFGHNNTNEMYRHELQLAFADIYILQPSS